jgi:hypothetical protein
MKHSLALISVFFLLLIVALVLTTAQQTYKGEATTTTTPWRSPRLTPAPRTPTLVPGWWNEIPTPVPLPSPIPRK